MVSTATHIASDLLAELTHQEQIYHDISQNLTQMHDEFVSLEKQLREPVLASLLSAIQRHLDRRAGEGLQTGAVLFSNQYGLLGMTRGAKEILDTWNTARNI